MESNICLKIADEISDQLISLSENSRFKKKTLLEIYDKLLDQQFLNYRTDILSYIPGCLASKGYEIKNTKYFELIKY